MKRVAFFAYGIGDISGGGGYERFFSDFFSDYNKDKEAKYELLLITDNIEAFKKEGRLTENFSNVIQFTDYRYKLYYDLTDKWFLVKKLFKWYRTLYTQRAFLKLLRENKVDILHLPNYLQSYFFLISYISKAKGIKTAVTVVDCRIPFKYNSNESYYVTSGATAHTFKPLFENVKLDGIFTWYKSFKEFVIKNKLVSSSTKIYPVTSRYINYSGQVLPFSQKENEIIFAGRLDDQKRPLMFAKAVKLALQKEPKLLDGWKFKIYGKGILEKEIRNYILENHLEKNMELSFSPDMKNVLNGSKALVSVQEYENFPSLSIYEAMVTGNAIIAFNVGQTADFIKHNENGILVEKETEEDLANAIITYISRQDVQELFYRNNIKLCSEKHTYHNFKKQVEEFWDHL
jgi:glycosyltransferase involved in cell wall biosynthesis